MINYVIKHDNSSLSFLSHMAARRFSVGSRFFIYSRHSKKKFQFTSCFFSRSMVIYLRSIKYIKYPGVAKFGIALDWGSRGRRFKSCHSDQP